jgi:GT2 family glycosyltransferase
VHKAGYRVVYAGNTSVVHLEGFTTSEAEDETKKYKSFHNYQSSYIYYGLRYFLFLGRIKVFAYALLGSIISVEGRGRARRLTSIRIKSAPLKRFIISLRAINNGYKLYLHYKHTKTLHFRAKSIDV